MKHDDVLKIKHLTLKGDASFTKLKVTSKIGDISTHGNFTTKFLMKSTKEVQVVLLLSPAIFKVPNSVSLENNWCKNV